MAPNGEGPAASPGLEPSAEELKLRRFVCSISGGPEQKPLGTGILIGPDCVLTCAHVLGAAGSVLDADTMGTVRCEFDNYQRPDGMKITYTVHALAKPPLKFAPWVETGKAEIGEDPLDYAIFKVSKLKGTNELIGKQRMPNSNHEYETAESETRGWLDLGEAANLNLELEVRLISMPNSGEMRFSRAGQMVHVAGTQNRWHYTNDSDKGSSGGLCYQVRTIDGAPLPIAMHSGRIREVIDGNSGKLLPAKFGVPFHRIQDDASLCNSERQLSRLKCEIIIAAHGGDDKKTKLLEEINALFEKQELQAILQSFGYIPLKDKENLGDLQLSGLLKIDADNNIKTLREAAKADLVLIFASAEDCADPHQRDRLTSAYGFLVARLGRQRVQLVYPETLPEGVEPLNGATFSSQEFVHRYKAGLNDLVNPLKKVFSTIKRKGEEDESGLFELAQVALDNKQDEEVLGEPHFDAESTLHILGLRFGNLAKRMESIIDRFMMPDGREATKLTIAFPGIDVWKYNRGWREQLQGGGEDTIAFLEDVLLRRDRDWSYGEQILSRISFVAINEIPTFILTAADIDTTWGRMLIAPAFKHSRDSAADTREKPRLLVHNKLSQAGLFHAYRHALRRLLDPTVQDERKAETGIGRNVTSWTLAEPDDMVGYINALRKVQKGNDEALWDGSIPA